MPHFGPLSRRKLIQGLRKAGFEGPINSGQGDHPEYMEKGALTVTLPNPHRGDIGIGLLKRILAQAGIDRASWEELG